MMRFGVGIYLLYRYLIIIVAAQLLQKFDRHNFTTCLVLMHCGIRLPSNFEAWSKIIVQRWKPDTVQANHFRNNKGATGGELEDNLSRRS